LVIAKVTAEIKANKPPNTATPRSKLRLQIFGAVQLSASFAQSSSTVISRVDMNC
jgi:hypothetical protein